MTPLLEAAVAAREVGLDVPKCGNCVGHGWYRALRSGEMRECDKCHATGINPDPARMGWVALMWLADRNSVTLYGFPVVLKPSVFLGHQYTPDHEEDHDRTETGIATALLRLVARVGGAK